MKVTLEVHFASTSDRADRGSARLDLNLPFAPSPDIEFRHPVWERGRKPESISYDTENDSFLVYLGTDALPTAADCVRWARGYEGHGWTLSGVEE